MRIDWLQRQHSTKHLQIGRGWMTGRTTWVGVEGWSWTAGGAPFKRSSAKLCWPVSWRHSRNKGKARLPRVSKSRTNCLAWSRLVPELWHKDTASTLSVAPSVQNIYTTIKYTATLPLSHRSYLGWKLLFQEGHRRDSMGPSLSQDWSCYAGGVSCVILPLSIQYLTTGAKTTNESCNSVTFTFKKSQSLL